MNINQGKEEPNKRKNDKNKKTKKNKNRYWDDDAEFIVERIITRRIFIDRIQYLIKWKNYKDEDSTWENLEHLIEDNCFGKIFEYENLPFDDKLKLLKTYEKLDIIKRISPISLKQSENHRALKFFKEDYMDFNPLFKSKFQNWEFGNLNDDDIDYMVICQVKEEKILLFKCFWKKRQGEDKPRKPRYYPYYVIQNVAKENFHEAFESLSNGDY